VCESHNSGIDELEMMMSNQMTERFNESVWEQVEELFPLTRDNFPFFVQLKDKLYDLLINDYADECYHNGVQQTILDLVKKL
jgi:hypothetical protein